MRVIETSLDEDLSLFSSYLWQSRVVHRVFEERGAQVLEVRNPEQADAVRGAYAAWKAGTLTLEAAPPAPRPARGRSGVVRALLRYPGLTLLIGLCVVVFPFSYPLTQDRLTALAAWLTIVDPRLVPAALPSLTELLAQGQVWRWITPMFLHFSVLHLAFNCVVTLELGRRIESVRGAGGFWLLVVVLSAVSNLAQYALGGGPLFGGLSGVAYGLLGYVLVLQRLLPGEARWHLPPGLAIGLLVFLVVFTTGITEPFGLFVANAAHWSGLVAGALAGVAAWRVGGRA